jgi:CRISPR/Cas system-associated exonuclease Cas4 (RecB family)
MENVRCKPSLTKSGGNISNVRKEERKMAKLTQGMRIALRKRISSFVNGKNDFSAHEDALNKFIGFVKEEMNKKLGEHGKELLQSLGLWQEDVCTINFRPVVYKNGRRNPYCTIHPFNGDGESKLELPYETNDLNSWMDDLQLEKAYELYKVIEFENERIQNENQLMKSALEKVVINSETVEEVVGAWPEAREILENTPSIKMKLPPQPLTDEERAILLKRL